MKRSYLLGAIAVSVVLMMAAWSLSAQAAPLALPPRPSPEPTVANAPAGGGGGSIKLQVEGAARPAQLWTTIQWQNQSREWYTVEGWQGAPFEDGCVWWWVQHSDLGKGPFRWMIYSAPAGKLLATSDPFRLPSCDGATELVTVRITP